MRQSSRSEPPRFKLHGRVPRVGQYYGERECGVHCRCQIGARAPKELVEKEHNRIFTGFLERKGDENIYTIRAELRSIMDRNVGVFRTLEELQEAYDTVRKLKERFEKAPVKDKTKIYNTDLTTALEVENLLDLAEASVKGALTREESRGGHARRDFPTRDDDKWLKHTLATYTPEGAELGYSKVDISSWKPVERKY